MGGKARPAPAGVRWLGAIGGLVSVAVLVLYLSNVHLDRAGLAFYPAAIYFVACLAAGSIGGMEIARRTDFRVALPSFLTGLYVGLAIPTALSLAPLLLVICVPFLIAAGWLFAAGGQKPLHLAELAVSVVAGFVAGAVPIPWLAGLHL